MPKFHIELEHGTEKTPDEDGAEYTSAQAARQAAVKGVRAVLADDVKELGRLNLDGSATVLNDQREVVETIRFDSLVLVTHSIKDR